MNPVPFEIVEHEGGRTGTNGTASATLLDAEGRMFRRRGVRGFGGASPQAVEWLVVELNGVRVYVDGPNIVVTTKDLMP